MTRRTWLASVSLAGAGAVLAGCGPVHLGALIAAVEAVAATEFNLQAIQATRSCPTVATTPAAVKAAFTKEGDLFKEKGVLFLDTFVNLSKPDVFERQMWEQFKDILGLSPEENARAIREGFRALDQFNNVTMRGAAREVLEQLEKLPPEEQREVFEHLRDKFDDELTPEEAEELDRRAERALAHPEHCRPLDEVVAEIENRFRAPR